MEYALDFGTSNTVIARRTPDGTKEIVAIVPSVVYVKDAALGEVIIGQEPVTAQPARIFRNFKRAIASTIEGYTPELDGIEITAKQVGIWFLQGILKLLENPSRIVLTVPVESFESYRQWLIENVSQLDVAEIRIIDESTAAALGYGITDREQLLLVIDWGGGTVDFSIVKIFQLASKQSILNSLIKWADRRSSSASKSQPTAKVLAKTGQNLGGMDIDYWIMNYLTTTQSIPKSVITKSVAEQLKIMLAQQSAQQSPQQSQVVIPKDGYLISFDREALAEILVTNKLYLRLEKCLEQLHSQLQRTNQTFADLSAVLLVGGTSQLPNLHQWLTNYFGSVPVRHEQPFQAIALGALTPNWELEDFLYHSYGIRHWDRRHQCHNWQTIFPAGQTYPTTKPHSLILGASLPAQTKIELLIGELESTNTELIYENEQLTTKTFREMITKAHPLNDLVAPLDPPGEVGIDRLKVEFSIDRQRTLRVTVTDLLTHKILFSNQPVISLQ